MFSFSFFPSYLLVNDGLDDDFDGILRRRRGSRFEYIVARTRTCCLAVPIANRTMVEAALLPILTSLTVAVVD